MPIKATLNLQLTVEETFSAASLPFGNTGQQTVTSGGLNKNQKYDANSIPDGSVTAYGSLPMVAGVAAINLAAVASAQGSFSMIGKKPRAILLRAGATNVGPITVAKGASNGYTGFGSAFALTLGAGKQALIQGDDTIVASGNRTLDVSGTGTDSIDYEIVAGDV
jgi:hypothetical protein